MSPSSRWEELLKSASVESDGSGSAARDMKTPRRHETGAGLGLQEGPATQAPSPGRSAGNDMVVIEPSRYGGSRRASSDVLLQIQFSTAEPVVDQLRGFAARLCAATQTPHHLFVPSGASLLDEALFDTQQLLGHRQVTDAWLLGLAVAHGLRFVTFDARLPLRVVHGATAGQVVVL